MISTIYNVVDLGPGDGGKGTVVHKIATMTRAKIVLKGGGAQGSHGVTTSRGESYAFSQWGCGTLEGIKTHLTERFIASPEGLLNEAEALWHCCGVYRPFELLTIDRRVLCATQYHGIASRLKELARGDNPRGTIGTGVGEAYRYLQRFPELTIRAGDLARPDLRDRLAAVREQIRRDLAPIIAGQFLPDDCAEARREIDLLDNDDYLNFIAERFREAAILARVVDEDYLQRELLALGGVAVVENSHGILTDHYYGFYPHVSAIRNLPCFTQEMLRGAGYRGEIRNIGVHRAYEIRHGAGPMPTDDPAMAETLLPGSSGEASRYRGQTRVGPIDLVLLRYALEVCGGPNEFYGLAVTWFDQIQANGVWQLCDRYQGASDQTYFSPSGEIKVRRGVDDAQLEYQENLGRQLLQCQPQIVSQTIPAPATRERLYALCAGILQEKVAMPVRMVSLGPTERDKLCK